MEGLRGLPPNRGPMNVLIQGVHDHRSIGWAIARAFADDGAEVCITYRTARTQGRVEALASQLRGGWTLPLDVDDDAAIAGAAQAVGARWGRLDGLVACASHADPEALAAGLTACRRHHFQSALETSAYSLVALSRAMRPLFQTARGGSITAISYIGARRVIPGYGVMGVAKAALEATVRYLAADLGREGIRVNAISAGPMRTVAASGVPGSLRPSEVAAKAPLRRAADQADAAALALHLAHQTAVSGTVIEVDGGLHLHTA